jgi:hypothetical protein
LFEAVALCVRFIHQNHTLFLNPSKVVFHKIKSYKPFNFQQKMARGEQTIRLLKSLKGFEDILKPYRKNFSYPTFDSKGNLDFNEISSDPS